MSDWVDRWLTRQKCGFQRLPLYESHESLPSAFLLTRPLLTHHNPSIRLTRSTASPHNPADSRPPSYASLGLFAFPLDPLWVALFESHFSPSVFLDDWVSPEAKLVVFEAAVVVVVVGSWQLRCPGGLVWLSLYTVNSTFPSTKRRQRQILFLKSSLQECGMQNALFCHHVTVSRVRS